MHWQLFSSCAECGAGYGERHWPGCTQAPSRAQGPGYARGQASAIRECRRRGWAVVAVAGEGFRPCVPDEPGAYLDLDRYAYWLEHGDEGLLGDEP